MNRERIAHLFIFLAVILPLVIIEYFSYRELERELLSTVLAERRAIAALSATVVKERFDRVKEVAVSLSTRVQFRSLVRQRRWEDAMAIMKEIPAEFPFVERIFLSDTLGTLNADHPFLPGVRGKNFAYRDWYKGVRTHWTPYLSEVYKRAAVPQLNVVTFSCPIVAARGERPAGILVIQIALETLLDWIKGITIGSEGYLFVLDHTGKLAAHPGYDLQNEVLDYSEHPVAAEVLGGESGVRIIRNPESRETLLTAFAPVPGYGWAVIAEEPEDEAFASQYATLQTVLFIYTGVLLLAIFFGFLIIRVVAQNQRARSEIQLLNKDLEERARQLEDLNRELEAFSYSVSHDLRAPLRHIDGFAQLLQSEVADEIPAEGKRFIKVISDSARTMSQLIDELLAFSRTGRAEMKTGKVAMNPLVEEVLKPILRDVKRRNIRMTVGSLPEVKGDPTMLRQVWTNLVSNAVKYTGRIDQPVIEIGHRTEDGMHVFFVRDNGAGFDMRYAHKLFGVFQRLHREDEFEGTGIGLAIVKRTILRHRGQVWAEGAVGRGATFYFSLPSE